MLVFVCMIQEKANSNWFPGNIDQRNQTGLGSELQTCKSSPQLPCDIYEDWDLLMVLNGVRICSVGVGRGAWWRESEDFKGP